MGVLFFMCYEVHHVKPSTLVIAQSTKWTWGESNPRPNNVSHTR